MSVLTARERDVLSLMAEGRSNTAIADSLCVSEGAVEKHVTNIFSKLDLPVSHVGSPTGPGRTPLPRHLITPSPGGSSDRGLAAGRWVPSVVIGEFPTSDHPLAGFHPTTGCLTVDSWSQLEDAR